MYSKSSVGQPAKYVAYNDPGEVNSVNINNWYNYDDPRVKIGTGRFLYSVEPRVPSYYVCSSDRDPQLTFIKDVDGPELPDHVAHFGYARCANGYCFGSMPGKFIVPDSVQQAPQPPDMAPKRFYTEERLSPWYVKSQSIVDYEKIMGITGQL